MMTANGLFFPFSFSVGEIVHPDFAVLVVVVCGSLDEGKGGKLGQTDFRETCLLAFH